jgi:heme oxygenase
MSSRTDSSLSARVRAGTRADHRAAQGSGFLDALAAGGLPIEAYAELAAQHWFIYQTLEHASRAMIDEPVAGRFVSPEIYRESALAADLRFLYGPRWRERVAELPSTASYCTRMRSVAFDHPAAFVAHHYTRYLGDLSGGQYVGPAIADAYRMNGDGHRFFVFEGVDPPGFRARYRRLLDDADWPPSEQDRFLAEVSEAYRHNIVVLAELKERWTP